MVIIVCLTNWSFISNSILVISGDGGSGNNFGSVLGGFLIFFLWVQVEPIGAFLMQAITSGMAEDNGLRIHLLESVAHMRLLTMGMILILVLRFAPKGLIPEK